ncbi:MAG TPA: competence type IV pilus minor pilin ComGF, partial [Alloiococcus sp.]|nr:competence type IV pilus minor pilin ComGF [Alloiococcus sp.]
KVNQNFIRRVNNGTQPMVMNIRSVSFKNEGQSLLMTGNFNNGEQYQARIWIDSWYANETS